MYKKTLKYACTDAINHYSLGNNEHLLHKYTVYLFICASSHRHTGKCKHICAVLNVIVVVLPHLWCTRNNFTHGISCYNFSLRRYGRRWACLCGCIFVSLHSVCACVSVCATWCRRLEMFNLEKTSNTPPLITSMMENFS